MLPGHAANPRFLVWDTSALLPFLFANSVVPLRALQTQYGIPCVIVEAVESEVRSLSHGKFPAIEPMWRKALANGVVTVLTRPYLREAIPLGGSIHDSIELEGREFVTYCDRGEAYSHAAANVLEVPIATQDASAVQALRTAGYTLSGPLLRVFDLIALAYQSGEMTMADCEEFLSLQKTHKTPLPPAFKNASFEDGLSKFYPRILDRQRSAIGAAKPESRNDNRIWISRPKPVLGAGV